MRVVGTCSVARKPEPPKPIDGMSTRSPAKPSGWTTDFSCHGRKNDKQRHKRDDQMISGGGWSSPVPITLSTILTTPELSSPPQPSIPSGAGAFSDVDPAAAESTLQFRCRVDAHRYRCIAIARLKVQRGCFASSSNVSSGYVRSVAPRRSQLARNRHRALMLAAHKDPTTIKKDI
jgi:hypothetical protein